MPVDHERRLPADPPSDFWAEWEGIPLCHVARSPEEETELRRKGVCGPACG